MAPINLPDGSQVSEIVLPDGSTASEVVAPDGSTVFSAIPDTAIHRRNAGQTSESDGQTVDPWSDLVGSDDLVAVGDPTLDTGAVNNQDAVRLDGTDDAYRYADNLGSAVKAPATIIWAISINSLPSSGLVALWSDDNGNGINDLLFRTDEGQHQMKIGGDEFNGGTPETGDQIITLTVSGSNGAAVRKNGTEIASLGSSNIGSSETILNTTNNGSFYADADENRRYLDAWAVEDVVHDVELTGSDLTDEEQRVEDEANMSVL